MAAVPVVVVLVVAVAVVVVVVVVAAIVVAPVAVVEGGTAGRRASFDGCAAPGSTLVRCCPGEFAATGIACPGMNGGGKTPGVAASGLSGRRVGGGREGRTSTTAQEPEKEGRRERTGGGVLLTRVGRQVRASAR